MPSPGTRLYLITDRGALGDDPAALDALVRLIGDAASAGVDFVQIRERDLPPRRLFELCRDAAAAVRGSSMRLLVNDRVDVALAAGIDGVHLTTRSIEPRVVRAVVGDRLLVAASTHSAEELEAARDGRVDFAVCGPVFETPSKRGMGEPLGPEEVARLASAVDFPVFALGGLSAANARDAVAGPVAGIAAIRLFQEAWIEGGRDALAKRVAVLRGLGGRGGS